MLRSAISTSHTQWSDDSPLFALTTPSSVTLWISPSSAARTHICSRKCNGQLLFLHPPALAFIVYPLLCCSSLSYSFTFSLCLSSTLLSTSLPSFLHFPTRLLRPPLSDMQFPHRIFSFPPSSVFLLDYLYSMLSLISF